MITPILTYGCEVWGYEDCKILEGLHLKYCKYILGLKKTTPNVMIYGELGRYPIDIEIKSKMLGYWQRILRSKENKLTHVLYNILLKLYNENIYKSPWLSCIHATLNNCGLNNVWLMQENILSFSEKWIALNTKRILQNQFVQNWFASLGNSSKCMFYASFKEKFEMEPYLLHNGKEIYRHIIRFRTCNHNLPIEKGRYLNIERSNRRCEHCLGNMLGDEFHYVCECENAQIVALREKYLPKYYKLRPNMAKFVNLMQDVSSNRILCQKMSNFFRCILTIIK